MLERLEKLGNTGHEYINVRVWATDKTYFLKRETCFVDSDHMNAEFIYEINGKIVHASLWNINMIKILSGSRHGIEQKSIQMEILIPWWDLYSWDEIG